MADPKTMTKYELATQAGAGMAGSLNNEKYFALLLAKCTDDLEVRLDGLATAIKQASDTGDKLTRWVKIAAIIGGFATFFQALPNIRQCFGEFWSLVLTAWLQIQIYLKLLG